MVLIMVLISSSRLYFFKITFQKQKIHPQEQITTKIEKERLYGLTRHFVLIFQKISAKNSSGYWVNISQKCISFINFSTVIMSRLVIVIYLTLKL